MRTIADTRVALFAFWLTGSALLFAPTVAIALDCPDSAETFSVGKTEVCVWADPSAAVDELTRMYQWKTGTGADARTVRPQVFSYDISFAERPSYYDGPVDPARFDLDVIPPSFRGNANRYIVQFRTPPLPAYLHRIEALAQIRMFLPDTAVVVEIANQELLDTIRELEYVRAVMPHAELFKLQPAVAERMKKNPDETPVQRKYFVSVENRYLTGYPPGGLDAEDVADSDRRDQQLRRSLISQFGNGVANAGCAPMIAQLTDEQLIEALATEGVNYIESWVSYETPETLADGPADGVLNVADAFSETGLSWWASLWVRDGHIIGEVLDDEFNPLHQDLDGRAISNPEGVALTLGNHGALSSNVVFSCGAGGFEFRGLLPDGQPILGNRPAVVNDNFRKRHEHTKALRDNFDAHFITASGGSDDNLAYSAISREMDCIVHDVGLLTIQSLGNTPFFGRPEAWAKNVVAVGGVLHEGTAGLDDDARDVNVAHGPSPNQLVKPDLVHFSGPVRAGACFDGNEGMPDTGCLVDQYWAGGATSIATPLVAGHAGLVTAIWMSGKLEGYGPTRPHWATVKALMVASAHRYPDLHRNNQGWGIPHLMTLCDEGDALLAVDQTEPLAIGQSSEYLFAVNAGRELRATLVYSDPPGPADLENITIHDLDLYAIDPDGNEYWGNCGLLGDSNASQTGTVKCAYRDTVESVFVPITVDNAGEWKIVVTAPLIVGDSNAAAPYSLAVLAPVY